MDQFSTSPDIEVNQPQQLSTSPPDVQPPVDQSVAGVTAVKAKYGIPGLTGTHEDIMSNILSGGEDLVRREGASLVDLESNLRRNQVINELASKNPRPFSPVERDTLDQYLKTKPTNPNSVFEEFFAKTYMENLRKAAADNPDSFMNEARIRTPEVFEKAVQTGVDLKAKKEWLETLSQKIQDQSGGLVRKGFNWAKYLIPFYNEFNLRGVSGDYQSLLGTNLDRVGTDLFHLPYDQFKTKTASIVDGLLSGKLGGNPLLAGTFLQHLTDPSVSSTIVDNIFSALDLGAVAFKPTAIALRGRMAKASEDAIKKGVADVVKGMDTPTAFKLSGVRPELSGNPLGILSTQSFMADTLKNIEEASKKFSFPKQFFAENAFSPRTMSTSSFMQDTLKKIEASAHEAAGNAETAGSIQSARQLVHRLETTVPEITDSVQGLQSTFNKYLLSVRQDTRGLSQEVVNRLSSRMTQARDNLVEKVQNAIKVQKVPVLAAAQDVAKSFAVQDRKLYPGLSNMFMDSDLVYRAATNDYVIEHTLGKNGSQLFGTERTANSFIKSQVLQESGAFRAEPQGAGYVIKFQTPFDTTQPAVKSALMTLESNKTPNTALNALVGFLRTPNETLSKEQQLNRAVASYGVSQLYDLAREQAAEIRQLRGWTLPATGRRAKWNQWEQAMDELDRVKDPISGRYEGGFKTVGDLQDFYQNTFHRLADEQEISAAFAHRNLQEIKHQLANLQTYSKKTSVGAQTHTFSVGDPARETAKQYPFTKVKADGTRIVPDEAQLRAFRNDPESTLILGEKQGQERVVSMKNWSKSKGAEKVMEQIKTGELTLVRLTDPEERPFRHWKTGETQPKYVIGKNISSSSLEWDQVPRNVVPPTDYDHYIAQPIVRYDPVSKLYHYYGDRKMAGFNLRAMGADVARDMNNIKRLLGAGDIDGARAMHGLSKLPQDFEDIRSWFEHGITTEGLPIPAMFSKEHDFKVIPYNENINRLDNSLREKYGSQLIDHTKDRFKPEYVDPDHLWTLTNEGSRLNPVYKQGEVKFVSPVTAMNRAMNRVINDAYLADYKQFSVSHWLEETRPWLAISGSKLDSAPTYFFYNPIWKAGTPEDFKRNMTTANYQIQQFLGVQDKTSTLLHHWAQNLADATYGTKLEGLVPTWALPKLRDPIPFIRSMTFDFKMGLFALPQLWQQLQSFINITGIAGFSKAAPGVRATLLHQWTRFSHDPNILDHMDKLAQGQIIPGTARFQAGWWREAHDLLTSTGFEKVGLEHARLDNPFGYQVISHAGGDFLNFGRVAFTEGERATRIGAFYTAYLEYRETNPTGKIANAEARKILDRADLLTSNMSRASSSRLNQGMWSIPTQFMTYTLRTAELFLGKRLTQMERARLFGFNALAYGVPVSFGLTGLPLGDSIKQWALEDGYTVGSNFINTMVTEGVPSMLVGLITGKHYDIGEHWGPHGYEDALRSDKAWWGMLGGAATSTLAKTIGSFDGFYHATLSMLRDDDFKYKLTMEDYLKPLKEIYSVNAMSKLYTALNTGRWVSKNEGYITDVDKGNAIFMFLSGLNPQEQADMFKKTFNRKSELDIQNKALQEFSTQYRRWMHSMNDGNPEQADQYLKNAFAVLRISGYPYEKYPAAIAQASQDYESMIARTDFSYYLKDVPTTRRPAAQKVLETNQTKRDQQ